MRKESTEEPNKEVEADILPCEPSEKIVVRKSYYGYRDINDRELWNEIIDRQNDNYRKLNEYIESTLPRIEIPIHPEIEYLDEHVFPVLLPLLEKALMKAIHMECLKGQRNLYNGIDYIAETLWNTNVKYPERREKNLNIFLIPWVQEWLKTNPRQIFPKSWIWTKEEAALKIQAYVRGYNVRKREDVSEMRQFWNILLQEKRYNKAMHGARFTEIQIKID